MEGKLMKNNGIKNEMEIVFYLNGKKKGETHIIFQELLEKLYPDIKANDVIMAFKYHELAKCDIVLKVKPQKVPKIKSQIIDGQKCIIIPIDDNEQANVNGVDTLL